MALLYTLLCLVLFQILPIFAINKATCQLPNKVLTELQNRYNVKIYKTNISIAYDFDNANVKILPQKIVELSLNAASVSFTGLSMSQGKPTDEIVKKKFNTKPIIIHHMKKGNKHDCRMESSENLDTSLYLEIEEVEAAIIQLAEYCIESYVCEKFDSIIAHYYLQKQIQEQDEEQEEHNRNNPHPVIHRTKRRSSRSYSHDLHNDSCSDNLKTINDTQHTINAIMDFAGDMLISKVDIHKNGVVEIPDIYSEFKTDALFWQITGEVAASNGTFENVRNIKRVKNMILTHENLCFSMGSTYKLLQAKLNFGNYTVRFGKIRHSGELSVVVDSITMSAKVSVDYNQKPCVANLTQLDIDELGEINIGLTGLDFLDNRVSIILRQQIKSRALDGMRVAIVEKLNELQCENLRPV